MKVELLSGACGAEIAGIDLRDTSECNIKTIERVAFDEMSVDRQNTNETPTRVLWRLPS